MIAATNILKPPPARIGSIGNISLPRSMKVKDLSFGVAGGSLGILLGLPFGSFQFIIVFAILGAVLGVALVSWQPVKGETLLDLLRNRVAGRARQRKLEYDGERLAAYMGIARLHRIEAGPVRLRAGAIEVDADQVDERGAFRSAENLNLAPVRPHLRDRPRFVPLYDSELPEEMRAVTGAGTITRTRVADHPLAAPGAPLVAPVVSSRTLGESPAPSKSLRHRRPR